MADKNIKLRLDYSEFKGSISECQSSMQMLTNQFKLQQAELGNNANEMDKLALTHDMLNQKIQLQEQVVQQAMEKWDLLVNSEDASVQQMDRAQASYLRASTALQNLKNELEETDQKMTKLTQETENNTKASEEASQSVKNLDDSFIGAVGSITAFTGAISAVVGEISQIARESASAADDIATMAVQYGVSRDTMESWVATAGLTDVSAETLGSSMSKLTREMQNAASGSQSSIEKFKALGVSATDSSGRLRNTEQVFYEVIDALGSMSNATERDASAMDLLGRSAQQLNPIIQMGSENFRKMQESAVDLIPDSVEDNLNELSDAFDNFDMALESGQNMLVGSFAPAITGLLNIMSSLSPQTLAVISVYKLLFSALSSLAPIIQMVSTMQIASAVATTSDATAKELDTIATVETTGANMSFVASIMEVVTAFMPQILTITALVAALALLGFAIAAIVDAFNQSSDAADKANESYQRLTNTASGLQTNSLALSTSHFANGSTTGGAGGLAWVGEQGAELVRLPYGSTVYNHEESKSMSSTSTNNYYVTIDAKNVNDFNKVVKVFSNLDQSMNRGGFVNG